MPDPSIFTQIINSYLPEPHASLLNGILFGVSVKTSKLFYTELKTVGLVHIVVLSGMNITILGAIITSVTYRLGKVISIIITIVSILTFILFVGVQPPILRAGIMAILTMLATLFGRKATTLYLLFLSAILILLFHNEWLTSISFQLSYAATLGLVLFGKSNHKIDKIPPWKKYITDEFRTSLSAQLFTAPLIFLYFGQISLISPLANLLVSWSIVPLMIFGFLTSILGLIHYSLGLLPSYICYILLDYIVRIVQLLSQIPFASINLR